MTAIAWSGMVRLVVLALAVPALARAELLFESSLRNGDYGAAQKIDTFAPNQGGSPHVLGIVDGPDGATYTSTEANGQSNALINWALSPGQALAFRTAGSVSFCLRVDRTTFVNGWILGDNYGFTAFNNGQGTFGSAIARRDNGTPGDPADDQWGLSFSSWHSNVWYYRPATQPSLDFGPWYRIGYTWGGPDHAFEEWADGTLISSDDRPELVFPWGTYDSATNVGLGDNHQRGIDGYGSAAGVTFNTVHLWTDARPFGDTTVPCGLCGNGWVEAGETCDDGNTDAGDCCGPTCQLENAGSPCADDGVACSADACDGAGACVHMPVDARCDDTNPCTADACSVPAGCAHLPVASSCDDGDACTTDACDAGACEGALATLPGLLCRVDELPSACASALPKSLAKRITGKVRKTHRLATRLEKAVAKNQAKKVVALRGAIAKGLAAVPRWTAKAVASADPRKQIAPTCREAIDGKVSEVQASAGTIVI